jgi:hypothetical protein
MTRQECEREIAKKLREIWDVYQEYAPGGGRPSLIVTDHSVMAFNEYWGRDTERPLDFYERVEEVKADANDEW